MRFLLQKEEGNPIGTCFSGSKEIRYLVQREAGNQLHASEGGRQSGTCFRGFQGIRFLQQTETKFAEAHSIAWRFGHEDLVKNKLFVKD
jgi:hypothetical protein